MRTITLINIAKQGYNLYFHIPRKYYPKFGPLKVKFNLSYACNSKCKHCQRWTVTPGKIKEELSSERYVELIDEAIALGALSFTFTGGEPFLRDDLFKLVEHAHSKGAMHIHVNTNGSLLKKNAEEILASKITSLGISLDTINKEKYMRMRGVDWVDRIKEGIEDILQNRKKGRPQISLSVTLTQENSDELEDILEYASAIGVDSVSIAPLHSNIGENEEFGSEVGNFLYPTEDLTIPEDINGIRSNLKRLHEEYRPLFKEPQEYYSKIPDFFIEPSFVYNQTCYTPSIILRVDPYGNVNPCEWMGKNIENLKNSSIKDIWFGEKFHFEREQILEDKHLPCWAPCDTPWNILIKKIKDKNVFKTIKSSLRYSKRID